MRSIHSLTRLALALAALLLLAVPAADAQTVKELRMLEAGGDSGEAVQAAYINPFQKKSGIPRASESSMHASCLTVKLRLGSQVIDTPQEEL